MQNNNDIYLLHEKYSSFFSGYYLLGSSDVWIPYFKKDIEVTYLSENNLTVAEEFVGKCIQRGIHKKSDIAKILALKENFLEAVIEPLVEQGFFTSDESNGSIYLSNEGKTLFAKKIKYLNKKETFSVLFDGLNETNKVEYLEYENKGFNRIKEAKNGILIDGRKFPVYDYMKDYQRLSKHFLSVLEMRKKNMDDELENSQIVSVKNFEYLSNKELLFRKYSMLVYADEKKELEVLVIDSVTEAIQPEFSAVLKTRLIEGYFNDDIDLEDAFKKHDKVINELSELASRMEEPADENGQVTTIKNANKLKYLMNAEIRRLFLHYLETAQKSLYIISPWMNYTIVNVAFKKNLEELLKRGVTVQIIYGITDGNEANFGERDKRSKKIADELIEIGKNYNGLLKIQNGQTHEKLLICDEKYYINGSYNFLSYDAEIKGVIRNEGTTYIEDEEFTKGIIKVRFDV